MYSTCINNIFKKKQKKVSTVIVNSKKRIKNTIEKFILIKIIFKQIQRNWLRIMKQIQQSWLRI